MRAQQAVCFLSLLGGFVMTLVAGYWLVARVDRDCVIPDSWALTEKPYIGPRSEAPPSLVVPLAQTWAVSEESLLLSEHRDIKVRGKFQQKQMLKLCQRYGFPGEQHMPSSSEELSQFHRHLIFDDERKAIFCFVPKVGCTNLKRLMFYMSGRLPLETVDWPWVEDSVYLEPALRHASFLNKTLTEADRTHRLQTYFKFMVVRNPLERIVSGFRNKIEPPLNFAKQNRFPESVKKDILQRFRQKELLYWQQTAKRSLFNISVHFQEFVGYLLESRKANMNEHFRPSMDICHPCLIKYDFYGNFKNISHDAQALIERFQTNPRFYRDKSLHSSSEETSRHLKHYYGMLSHRDKVRLLGMWYDELLFYYTLYPSERNSHIHLLGINHPVL